MYPRVNYEMTKTDLEKLLAACKPVPCMMIGGTIPSSPQENANKAWAALGKEMGFDSTTVNSISGRNARCFSAVPTETSEQRLERKKQEAEKKRLTEIRTIEDEIKTLEAKLENLKEN